MTVITESVPLTKTAERITKYQHYISVEDATGFRAGDMILIGDEPARVRHPQQRLIAVERTRSSARAHRAGTVVRKA